MFPVIFAFDRVKGVQVVGVMVLSGWLNLNMKWLIGAERPYWYVKEHGLPDVHQTEITCETGPGSPSGHLMENYAMFYILADFITGLPDLRTKLWISRTVWAAFYVLIGLLFVSRTYCSAHFPDQCVLGIICGKSDGLYSVSLDRYSLFRDNFAKGCSVLSFTLKTLTGRKQWKGKFQNSPFVMVLSSNSE